MNPDPALEVVKWYTRARKFPQLIGRTPDGAKIWGGPYTFTQAVGAGVTLFVGVNTMGLWANHGLIGNAMILLGVAYGIVLLLGRIPVGSRSPIAVLAGCVRAVNLPGTGRLAGRAVRIRRPHVVRHRINVLLGPLPDPPLPSLRRSCAVPAGGPADAVVVGLSQVTGSQPRLTGARRALAQASPTVDRDI